MENPRERKIPVFSVWKNDSILKNIFLINTPPPPSLDQIQVQEGEIRETQKEFEETLVIGRHPDCVIRLDHPSISRFHLSIHSIPSSTNLSITDLSSVHRTWVSGKRIEPNVRTRLNEDDTLRIGGSSRVYKLHWIPFSQAYDMEHPFVPPLDFSQQQQDEEEENIKNDNSNRSENETVHLAKSGLKCLEDELVAEKLVNAEPYLEGLESSSGDKNSEPFLVKTSELLAHEYIPSAPPHSLAHEYIPSAPPHSLADGSEPSTEMIIQNENREEDCSWNFWYGSHIDVFPETENHNVQKGVDISSPKECEDRKLWSFWSGNMGVESLCSSFSDAEAFFSECENGSARNVYQSPEPRSSSKKHLRSPLMTSARNSGCSIWSRRGKQESSPLVYTSSKTKGKKMKTNQENVKDENPISRALFHDDQEEEEIFTHDKENFTPKTHKSMRKLAMLKEATRSNSGKLSLSKMTVSPDVSPASNKENYSPNVRPLLLKERKGERVPFQTLISESPQKSVSEACISDTTVRSEKSVNCPKPTTKTFLQEKCTREKTRKWNMVVDTTTLLNKGSRKALQLLAGLKGTQLIIPRIVVKELESLKRQTSFFRRNTEVLSALDWIQDCIAENQWWVHLQTSMEEGRPVAPTPRASPLSHLTCGTPFSAFGFRAEVITPTPDDHVLDYAICLRKARNDGQLILLSNDITLKIKAMAEGIICEGAEEFRESLVNPFSDRFLWADSSPRGQTWCCSDDIVLKEKFYPRSMKIVPKAMENVKGLKLILLHNSQYFERMTGFLH